MSAGRSLVVGNIISSAWTDPRFRLSFIRHPERTLRRRFGLEIPQEISIRPLQNTDRLLHLAIGTTVYALPSSPLLDLKQYVENYTDPRLEPLVWCARDPVLMQRLSSDPRTVLARWGIRVPRERKLRIAINSPLLIHVVLPARPKSHALTKQISQAVKAWGAPITLKYASLLGITDLRALVGRR